jgi:hypothetical protein
MSWARGGHLAAPLSPCCRFVSGQHPGKLQRKALALLLYCLRKQPADCRAACELGVVPGLVRALQQEQQDAQLREAALQVSGGWAAGVLGGARCTEAAADGYNGVARAAAAPEAPALALLRATWSGPVARRQRKLASKACCGAWRRRFPFPPALGRLG